MCTVVIIVLKGEIPKDDYVKILQVVNEIKVIPMTYELLKVGMERKRKCYL